MEQNKFDTDIKSKLEKRRLEPSEAAWQKLSERLDAEQGTKKGNSIFWLGIAASIVGILLLVSQFFKSGSSEVMDQPTPTRVVINPVNSNEEQKSNTKTQTPEQPQKKLFPTEENHPLVSNSKIEEEASAEVAVSQDYKVATAKEPRMEEKPGIQNPTELPVDNKTFEAQKIEDIVKNVQAVAESQQEITDAYLDSLLSAAEKDIQRQKYLNKTKGTVDADALLADVENELDESFRTKVFDALKSSFNSVKTAVANRNN